ncbi:MAG: TonB-dependent receptor [Deltaproteobacteria bacterium]|nr:TonB-dependent receptor [Deltaproteobacteria bacterium]
MATPPRVATPREDARPRDPVPVAKAPDVAAAEPAPIEDPAGETVVIDGRAVRGGVRDLVGGDPTARDRRGALATAPFVTIVHTDDHAGEPAAFADLIGATVGAHVRSLGGLGAFSSVSVRGLGSGQTAVYVDGVPLSRVASVTADLGRFDADAFDRVELYRGGAPVDLGGAAQGGALNLVSPLGAGPRGERWRASAGIGSFGARQVRLGYGAGDPADGTAVLVDAGYSGATGDFVYFDDGGTNLDPSDDHDARRANNAYDQGDAAIRAGGTRHGWRWRASSSALHKRQGVPGSAWNQALHTSLSTTSGLVSGEIGGAPFGDDGPAMTDRAFAMVEAQAFRDPDDEVGLSGNDRRYTTLAGGATSAWRWQLGRHATAAALELRGDWFRDVDEDRSRPATRGLRLGAGLALADDIELADARLVLSPAVRIDLARTRPTIDPNATDMTAPAPRTDLLPSPRLGARVLVDEDVAIKGSAGWYARLPTVVELYGDRGFVVGSPGLRPETGPSADLGVVIAPQAAWQGIDRILIEAAGFYAAPDDAIAYVSAGLVARPLNLGPARVRGAELSVTGRAAGMLTVTGNYTLVDAVQRSTQASVDGKRLPGRPRHELYVRGDLAGKVGDRVWVLWTDVAWTAGSFLDQSNLAAVPARTLVGAGAKVALGGGLLAGLTIRNVADARIEQVALDPAPRPDLANVPRAISDYGGYPLPGRALYLSLEWTY